MAAMNDGERHTVANLCTTVLDSTHATGGGPLGIGSRLRLDSARDSAELH